MICRSDSQLPTTESRPTILIFRIIRWRYSSCSIIINFLRTRAVIHKIIDKARDRVIIVIYCLILSRGCTVILSTKCASTAIQSRVPRASTLLLLPAAIKRPRFSSSFLAVSLELIWYLCWCRFILFLLIFILLEVFIHQLQLIFILLDILLQYVVEACPISSN